MNADDYVWAPFLKDTLAETDAAFMKELTCLRPYLVDRPV